MSAFFLFLAFALFFLFFQTTGSGNQWRCSFLLAAIGWSVYLVGVTEGLSLFSALTKGAYIAAWIVADIGLLAVLARRQISIKKVLTPAPINLDLDEWFMVAGGALLLGVTLTVALMAPPNSWDAMTYHMPRVMHWIQNQSVAFYPTHNIRQLYMPPFAEYTILGFRIATGSDWLSNLPQFFSMAGTAIGVSLIAKYFGADRRGQILSAVVALTIPTGVLEASGAKNDYVLSFWMVTFVFFGLEWRKSPDDNTKVALSGLALGFALFTKGTAYVLVLPFIIWFGATGFKTLGKNIWRPIVIVALFAVAINASLYLRNIDVFDHPLGTMTSEYEFMKSTNDIYTPAAFISNVVRNASVHLGTSSHVLNAMLLDAIKWLHESVLEIDINDPATTWREKFYVPWSNLFLHHENVGGSTVHFFLILLAPLLMFTSLYQSDKKTKPLVIYIAVIAASFSFLVFIFSWLPQIARFHLPLFLLMAPVIGLVVSSVKYRALFSAVVAFVLIVQAAPPALMNWRRPLMPITDQLLQYAGKSGLPPSILTNYQRNLLFSADRMTLLYAQPFREKPYRRAAAFLGATRCTNIGFISDYINDPTSQSAMEYQFWILLHDTFPDGFRFDHVYVQNRTKILTREKSSPPCGLIRLHELKQYLSDKPYVPPNDSPIEIDGVTYKRVFFDLLVGVYLPEGEGASLHPLWIGARIPFIESLGDHS